MKLNEFTDHQLIVMYVHGCETAFDEIFSRHYESLFNYLIKMVSDKERAREILQDSFVRVARSAATYEPKAKFSTWLFKIATNLCLTFLKKESGRFQLLQFPVDYSDRLQKTPFDAVRDLEINITLEKAISGLNINLRSPFVLHELNEFTYAKVALILDIPEGTVKIRVHRARKKLQQKLIKEVDFLNLESVAVRAVNCKKSSVVSRTIREK